MIPEDIAKLKAADIRAELSSRGLPTKGDKAALTKRLTNALQNSNVPTSNRFDPLNPNESVDGSNLNNSLNSSASTDSDAEKKVKIPPLLVSKESTTAGNLITKMKAITNNFKIRDVKEFFKIETSDSNVYRSTVNMLDTESIAYHSYRLPTEKTFDVVLKHIPTTFGENEIQNELVNLGFSVFKLMRVWDKNKQPIPVVNVYLDKKNPKNKEIFDLDRLLYCVISVEPKRRSYNVPQCNNCQRYGHTRNYCKLSPRCMFCAGKHKSAECMKDMDVVSTCANCGESHASNFKGCSYYKELKSRRFTPKDPLTQAAQHTTQHAEPPPDISSFPLLSPVTQEPSVPSSPLQSSQDHSYARHSSGPSNARQSPGPSNSWNNNTSPPNLDYLTSFLMNSIKPIIEMIMSNIKPLIENCIKNCLDGSK